MSNCYTCPIDAVDYVVAQLQPVLNTARTEFVGSKATIVKLQNDVEALTKLLSTEKQTIESLNVEIGKQQLLVTSMIEITTNIKVEREMALMEKTNLLKTISDLEHENVKMVEENKSFFKVSQIIMYEKENARLKRELEYLQSQVGLSKLSLSKLGWAQKTQNEQVVVEAPPPALSPLVNTAMLSIHIEHTDDKKESDEGEKEATEVNTEDVEEDIPELNVYEKKIKGIMYYVSDNEEMKIYEQLDDGEIGEEVGYYEKKDDGKRKIVWTPSSTKL
jgi:hypothetical protein